MRYPRHRGDNVCCIRDLVGTAVFLERLVELKVCLYLDEVYPNGTGTHRRQLDRTSASTFTITDTHVF